MGKEYIRNLAASMIGQLKITVMSADNVESLSQRLYELHNNAIHAKLLRMRPETLGKIAACGCGPFVGRPFKSPLLGLTMFQVQGRKPWLNELGDGFTLLQDIACTAIVAEMAEILYPGRYPRRYQ